jgi:hypothetical protein
VANSSPLTAPPEKPVEISQSEALIEIQKCFSGHPLLDRLSHQDRLSLADLQSLPHAQPAAFEKINLHFQDGGKEYRVMLLNGRDEGSENVRFFEVGTDGFPTRVELPNDWKTLSAANVFEQVRARKDVTLVQKTVSLQLDNDTRLRFTDHNGELREMMITLKNGGRARTLGCQSEAAGLKCRCVTSH